MSVLLLSSGMCSRSQYVEKIICSSLSISALLSWPSWYLYVRELTNTDCTKIIACRIVTFLCAR